LRVSQEIIRSELFLILNEKDSQLGNVNAEQVFDNVFCAIAQGQIYQIANDGTKGKRLPKIKGIKFTDVSRQELRALINSYTLIDL